MPSLLKIRLAVIMLAVFLPTLFAQAAPLVGGCQIFPLDNPWNADISGADVHANSDNFIANINTYGGDYVHPDFGSNPEYGIPYVTVSGTQPKVPVTFDYEDESDPGMYPIPPTAPIEGGPSADGDRHVLVIDTDNCVLYETYYSFYQGGAQKAWSAGSGAIWNLNSNALRPEGWTSADAAGLPIFPGLARCEEAMTGTINHALRFTVNRTHSSYIYPATHEASSYTDPNYPPMGLRLRLKASVNEGDFTGQALAIVKALKKYGMILADNGSNWYISGEANRNNCWDDDDEDGDEHDLNQLKDIPGTDFEVIDSPAPAPITIFPPSLHTPADNAALTSTQPVLDWNTVTGAAKYEIQFGSSNPPTTTVATVFPTSVTQFIPPNPLTSGFTYYWRVRAFDGTTPTAWSPTRGVVIASLPAANSTRNLYATKNPELTWDEITWATGYEIQVSANSSFTGTLADSDSVAANQSSYTTATLQNGTYYWHVRALGGSSSWSPTESFIIRAP
jgi:hypothetical protein